MDPAKVVSVLEGTMNPNLQKQAEAQLDQVIISSQVSRRQTFSVHRIFLGNPN